MSRGAHDGLLMVFTDFNILLTVIAFLIVIEVYKFPVYGIGLALMSLFCVVATLIMKDSHYIDGFTAFFFNVVIGGFQMLILLATVEIMMPINIWWFYYPVIYLAVWIFEGAYLMCRWGEGNGCKE